MTPIFLKSTPKNHPNTVEKSPVHQKVNKSQWDPLLSGDHGRNAIEKEIGTSTCKKRSTNLIWLVLWNPTGMQSYFLPDLRCFWPQTLFLGVILGPKSSIIGSENRVFARAFGPFSRKVLGIFGQNQNHRIREKKSYRPNLNFWPLTPPLQP